MDLLLALTQATQCQHFGRDDPEMLALGGLRPSANISEEMTRKLDGRMVLCEERLDNEGGHQGGY